MGKKDMNYNPFSLVIPGNVCVYIWYFVVKYDLCLFIYLFLKHTQSLPVLWNALKLKFSQQILLTFLSKAHFYLIFSTILCRHFFSYYLCVSLCVTFCNPRHHRLTLYSLKCQRWFFITMSLSFIQKSSRPSRFTRFPPFKQHRVQFIFFQLILKKSLCFSVWYL